MSVYVYNYILEETISEGDNSVFFILFSLFPIINLSVMQNTK